MWKHQKTIRAALFSYCNISVYVHRLQGKFLTSIFNIFITKYTCRTSCMHTDLTFWRPKWAFLFSIRGQWCCFVTNIVAVPLKVQNPKLVRLLSQWIKYRDIFCHNWHSSKWLLYWKSIWVYWSLHVFAGNLIKRHTRYSPFGNILNPIL